MNFRYLAILPSIFASSLIAAPIHGEVRLDGSSTVFPISEAVAEEFGAVNKSVRVTVGTSGTGGGFKKFCSGEIDINNASRQIRDSEITECKKKKIEFIEIPVAIDGLSIVVHPSNTFVTKITLAELKKIWEPASKIKLWSDLNPAWPKEKMALFGPGPDSGTFDYFTEEVVGKSKASRTDYTASEDDNVLLKGVAASKFGMGYFGHGYYMANSKKVRGVPVDAGKGAVEPSEGNVANGTYPLSRSLYIYVNTSSAGKTQVKEFVNFYLSHANRLSTETGYQPLPDTAYKAAGERFKSGVTGRAVVKPGSKT
jgi:phosphate transport system substrate-binding protein